MKKSVVMGVVALMGVALFAAQTKIKPGAAVTTNGWADVGGLSYPDTQNIIVIDDAAYPTADAKKTAFVNAIASGSVTDAKLSDAAAIIILSGTVDLSGGLVSDTDHSYFDAFDPETHQRLHEDFLFGVGSNKAILGAKDAKIAYGGLQIKANEKQRAQNIIIQNIVFWDGHGSTEFDTSVRQYADKKASADQLSIEASFPKNVFTGVPVPENIWIDHCSFSDGVCVDLDRNYNHDGSLDIKAGRNITISYCEFTNHDKVTLIGSSDKFIEPSDREITFHHNYYHGCVQRMPRTRGGYFHLYNNVYEDIGTKNNSGASLGPGVGSQYIVENNFFGKHQASILKGQDPSDPGTPTFYKIFINGNSPELVDANAPYIEMHKVAEKPWTPQYKYSLQTAKKAYSTVPKEAGATLSLTIDGKKY